MRLRTVTLRATLILLISGSASAQSGTHGPDHLFARLSYSGGHVVDWRREQGNPQICFALYRSGYYRVSRLTEGGTETLQGTLSEDQVIRFRSMLENLDFQSSGGAVTRNGAEVLVTQVVRKGRTIHYVWIDPDHKRPFPSSAMSIVKWLQDFKPEGGSPLTVRELSDQPSICPLASKPLLPLFASLHPAPQEQLFVIYQEARDTQKRVLYLIIIVIGFCSFGKPRCITRQLYSCYFSGRPARRSRVP